MMWWAVIVCFLLRLPTMRMPLENNGGAYLYNARFQSNDVDITGQRGFVLLLHGCYRVFGDLWQYRWVRLVTAIANAACVVPIYYLSGWQGGWLYALFSNGAQLMPWYTNGERVGVVLTATAYALMDHPLLAGCAAGLSIFCKVTSAPEFIPLLLACRLPFAAGLLLALLPEVIISWRHVAAYRNLAGSYRRAERMLGRTRAAGARHPALYWSLWTASGIAPLVVLSAFGPPSLLLAWWACTFLTMVYRGTWVPGHWVPMVAPLAAMAGCGAAKIGLLPSGLIVLVGLVLAVLTGRRHPYAQSQMLPFLRELERCAARVRGATQEGDSIFVVNWHPQIYVLAGRRSVCPTLLFTSPGYLDVCRPGWRLELEHAWAKNPPALVVGE